MSDAFPMPPKINFYVVPFLKALLDQIDQHPIIWTVIIAAVIVICVTAASESRSHHD